MGVFLFIVGTLIIVFVVNNYQIKQKEKRKEKENALIKRGTHVRLTNGYLVETKDIRHYLLYCEEHNYIYSH